MAPNTPFKIVHDSKRENVKYVSQNKVFCLFVKSQRYDSNSPCPCCCTFYPKIILFLICSFHLCPSPLSNIKCNMCKAVRPRGLKLTACVLKSYCTCVCLLRGKLHEVCFFNQHRLNNVNSIFSLPCCSCEKIRMAAF